jgi:NAD(P)-dependent dehydrogenase (short-subunit alcohol dehydrogenase family)
MTKHAVVGLSTSLRIEAKDHGVRVSALCPSGIDTPLLDSKGPSDLPQGDIDVRRYLRRSLGTEHPVDKFVTEALRGVARNQALVIAPARARVAARLTRWVPGLVAKSTHSTVRKERAERAEERVGQAAIGG